MTTAANKELMQEIFNGLANSDASLFFAGMADNFRWTLTGRTKWSRTYDGKQVVLKDLIGPLRALMAGRMKTVPLRFIADEDFVVVEARGQNTTKAGVPYNNEYCYVFRLSDGKLRELTEYFDTELVTAALGDPADVLIAAE